MGKIQFYLGVVLIHLGVGMIGYGVYSDFLLASVFMLFGGGIMNFIFGGYVYKPSKEIGGKRK